MKLSYAIAGHALAAAMLIAMVAKAEEKLTIAQAMSLLSALRNLDGHTVVVKQNGVDTTVMIPWDFASGALRLKIATNITVLAKVEKSAEDARQGILKEIGKAIAPGSPELETFVRQYGEVLNAPADAPGLMRIKASELKLDKNEIPATALSAMAPILDANQ